MAMGNFEKINRQLCNASLLEDSFSRTVHSQATSGLDISATKFQVLIVLLTLFLGLIVVKLESFKRKNKKGTVKSVNEGIPSLPSLPLIGPIYHVCLHRDDIAKLLETWSREYPTVGKSSLFGKPFVIINSPAILQKLHSSTHPGHLEKPEIIYSKLFVGMSGKGLFFSKVGQWAPHRKLLSKAFNYESLRSYVSVFNKHAHRLVSDLSAAVDITDCKNSELGSYTNNNNNGESLSALMHACCLEIINEIIFGANMEDSLTRQESLKFHKNLTRVRDLITYRFYNPWLLSDFTWNFHPHKREMETCLGVLEDIYSRVLEDALSSKEDVDVIETESRSTSVIDVMKRANWSTDEILSEAVTLLLGGHETITTAMNFLLFLLATEPEHQKACQEEVDNLFLTLNESGKEISIESVSQLKYLERCVKETLRMFPTAPFNWRQLKAPLVIDEEKGTQIDAGTIVLYTIWSVHRNPKYYPNPGKFDPDRFLPENCKQKSTYIPFSAGARNCIGWKMALLEMTTIAAVFLRHFDVFTSDKLEDIKVKFTFTIWPDKEPKIELRRRSISS